MAWIKIDKRTDNKHLQYRFKRADGTWAIKSIKLGDVSKAQAKIILQRFEQDENYLKLDLPLPPSQITIKELAKEYIESFEGIKGVYTIDRERKRLKYFCDITRAKDPGCLFRDVLNPEIRTVGDMMISQLSPETIERYIFAKKYKPNSARLLTINLRALYKYAVGCKYLPSNPMLKLRSPKLEKLPPRNVDPEIVDKVLACMSGHVQDYYLILKYTGMRPGEALKLQVRDISTYGLIVRHTKTKRFRVVPTHDKLKIVLKRLAKRKGSEDYLFPSPLGGHQKSMKKGLKLAVDRAGVTEKICSYSFRHTFATELLGKTGNLRAVQGALGHSSSVQTERYSFVMPDYLKTAINSLD